MNCKWVSDGDRERERGLRTRTGAGCRHPPASAANGRFLANLGEPGRGRRGHVLGRRPGRRTPRMTCRRALRDTARERETRTGAGVVACMTAAGFAKRSFRISRLRRRVEGRIGCTLTRAGVEASRRRDVEANWRLECGRRTDTSACTPARLQLQYSAQCADAARAEAGASDTHPHPHHIGIVAESRSDRSPHAYGHARRWRRQSQKAATGERRKYRAALRESLASARRGLPHVAPGP